MAKEGLYGSEVREGVKDPLAPNLGQAAQPKSIGLSGVSSPRGADFSQVGEGQRVMSKLLGEAGGILDKYVESNRKQWELEGRMKYAQGVTEKELYDSGNKHQIAGFLAMKTDVAANSFFENSLAEIEKTGREVDPNQYREDLSKKFKSLTDELGNDPYVSGLLAAKASEMFPRLVTTQTKANNEWKYNQQKEGFRDLAVSRSNFRDPTLPDGGYSPDDLRKLTDPKFSGLRPEDHRAGLTSALEITLSTGNTRLAEALIGADGKESGINVRDLPPSQQLADSVVGGIMKNELHADGVIRVHPDGDGEAIGGINSKAYPAQFLEASTILKDKGQEAALQYIRSFYDKEIIQKNGIPNLPADVQDVVADGMVNHWYGFQKDLIKAAEAGKSRSELLQMRRNEYLRLAAENPDKYGANLEGWLNRLNKIAQADLKEGYVQNSAIQFITEKRLAGTLAANGFNEGQINSVVSSYKRATAKNDAEFDSNRVLTEQNLIAVARKEGNLAARLEDIKAAQAIGGYSDKWADQQSNAIVSAVNDYNKEQTEFSRIDSAGRDGSLSFESSDKQKLGIDRERAKIASEVNANPDMNDEQKNDVVRHKMTDFLVRNSVVDPVWAKTMDAGLNGNILQKDGTVPAASIKAYQDYVWLKNNAPPGYAQQYLKGDAHKLIAMAESFDIGINTDQALVTAANKLYGKELGYTEATPRVAAESEVMPIIQKKIEENLNPGLFSFVSKFQAADAYDVKDSDIEAAKSDTRLNNFMMAQVKAKLALDPRATVESATNEVWNENVNRIELAPGGNVLISGSDYNIREKLGYPNANATNLVFKGLQRFAAKKGKAFFGPRYHGWTEDADKQFAMYKSKQDELKAKGSPYAEVTGKDERWLLGGKLRDASSMGSVHESSFVASPTGIVWTLRKKGEDGNWIDDGSPQIIPYDVLGDFMRQEEFADRSDRSLTDFAKRNIQDATKYFFGSD